MMWFGESWGAPVCGPDRHTPTPVGSTCVECGKPIVDDDTGFLCEWHGRPDVTVTITYHRVCFLRTVIPCEMWDAELRADMPDFWRQHWAERHCDERGC